MAFETRPLPVPSPESRPYWDGCKRHELLMQRCRSCGEHQFFPRVLCRNCLSRDLEWSRVSGRGRLLSYSVVHRPPSRHFAAEAPYTVALIKLEEGPQMVSQVVECPPDDVYLDMPVEVVFEDVSAEISLPKFRPHR